MIQDSSLRSGRPLDRPPLHRGLAGRLPAASSPPALPSRRTRSDEADTVRGIDHEPGGVAKRDRAAAGAVRVEKPRQRPLRPELNDPDPTVRRAAIAIERNIELLRKRCRTDLDAGVRQTALRALGPFHGPALLGDFLGALADTDPAVRSEAARVLGRSGLGPAVPALVAALRDRSWQVRRDAALALGRLYAHERASSLLPLLADTQPEVRGAVASVVGKLRLAVAVEPLRRLTTDMSQEVRQSTAQALEALGAA